MVAESKDVCDWCVVPFREELPQPHPAATPSAILHIQEKKRRRSFGVFAKTAAWNERRCTLDGPALRYSRPSRSAFRVRRGDKDVIVAVPGALLIVLPPTPAATPTAWALELVEARSGNAVRLAFNAEAQLLQWKKMLCAAGAEVGTSPAVAAAAVVTPSPRSAAPAPSSSSSSSSSLTSFSSSPSSSSSISAATAHAGALVPQTRFTPADAVPTRYLVDCKGDAAEAGRRWRATHAWRAETRMDEALDEPWPFMERFKDSYLHVFHNRARTTGSVVYYDRLDFTTMSRMVDEYGAPDLIRYYLFTTDYCYHALAPEDPGGRQVTVYDLSRMTLLSLMGSAAEPVKQIIKLYAVHYPERVDKIFLVNAPYFFTGVWNSIKPFLDPAVVSRISISTNGRRELLDYIGADRVPIAYGGTDPTPLGEAPEELSIRHHILQNRANLEKAAAAAAACDSPRSTRSSSNGAAAADDEDVFPAAVTAVVCVGALRGAMRSVIKAAVSRGYATRATAVALIAIWVYSFLSS